MKTVCSRRVWIVLLATLILGAGGAQAAGPFFQVRKIDGTWWLIDPDGHRFLSKGVTTVQFAQDNVQGTSRSPYGEANQAKYGSREAWRQAAAKRLIGWGFNTLGAWSDEGLAQIEVEGKHLAYAPTVDLGAAFVARRAGGKSAWLHGVFPDVFDPEFERTARRAASQRCAPRKDDRWLLGWFTDNELRWGPDWRGSDELLTLFLALPADAPGRKAAIGLLRQRHGDVTGFNDVWKTGFASWDELTGAGPVKAPLVRAAFYAQNQAQERKANQADPKRAAFVADCEAFLASLAERYFRVTCEAVKAADPNHLVFGCRFAYVPPAPVVAAAAGHLDAISFNCYATWALSKPSLVGYHWFEHADEPKEGRFDGENSNYGTVNIHDEPYQALTQAMTRLNAQAEMLHGKP